MNVLFTAIHNLFIADTGQAYYTAIGGRQYHVKAPQEATYPHVIFDLITGDDDLDFSDENQLFEIQFDIITQDDEATAAGTILAAMKTLYDDAALTVTGWRHLFMIRTLTVKMDDLTEDTPIMGYAVQYEVLLEKAK